MFGAQINGGFNFTLQAQDISGNPLVVFSMQLESDGALILKSGNPLVIPSPPPPFGLDVAASTGVYGVYFYPNVWYYFTLIVGIEAGTGPLLGFLQVSASLSVDGLGIIGAQGGSIPLSNFPTSGPALASQFVQASWFGNPGFSSQIQLSDPGVALPDTTTPTDRISQAPIELGFNADANVFITQAVDELGILPIHSNLRISQMVIELATPPAPSGSPGFFPPQYIKRRAIAN